MATVTGLTAARMLAIEGASVVSGSIDASGHLILTTHNGTQIDAGNALVAVPEDSVVNILQPGPEGFTEQIEPHIYPQGLSLVYITDTMTQGWASLGFVSGTVQSIRIPDPTDGLGRVSQFFQNHTGFSNEPDIWIRTGIEMYGWTAWRKLATQKYVDDKFAPLPNTKQPNDSITTYPAGVSMTTMAGNGAGAPVWNTIPTTQFGTILTVNGGTFRSFQLTQVEDGYLHFRRYREDGGGWRPWTKVLTEHRLTPADYTQSRVFTGYPWGLSYLYLNNTESAAGGWDFAGKFGMITTFRYSDDFAVQTWQKHQGGLTGHTEMWQRTANGPSGWSPWRIIVDDAPIYAIQLGNGTVPNAAVTALGYAGAALSTTNTQGYVRSTNRITVPAAGAYLVSYRFKFTAALAGRSFVELTLANVSNYQYSIAGDTTTFARTSISAAEDYGTVTATVALAAGAQIGANAFQSSGSAKGIDGVLHIQRTT